MEVYEQVLIETLWNVKWYGLALIMRMWLCFNRNIVECKVIPEKLFINDSGCFNRNIVECKVYGKKVFIL